VHLFNIPLGVGVLELIALATVFSCGVRGAARATVSISLITFTGTGAIGICGLFDSVDYCEIMQFVSHITEVDVKYGTQTLTVTLKVK
jgi:hypothetical protein